MGVTPYGAKRVSRDTKTPQHQYRPGCAASANSDRQYSCTPPPVIVPEQSSTAPTASDLSFARQVFGFGDLTPRTFEGCALADQDHPIEAPLPRRRHLVLLKTSFIQRTALLTQGAKRISTRALGNAPMAQRPLAQLGCAIPGAGFQGPVMAKVIPGSCWMLTNKVGWLGANTAPHNSLLFLAFRPSA